MLNSIRQKLANKQSVAKLVTSQIDLQAFRQKPTPRFIMGLSIMGISYITAWPLITVFGALAIYFQKPLLFAIGSPIAYGGSHLLFILGAFVAGKDTVKYMNVFMRWSMARGLKKLLGEEIVKNLKEKSEQ